MELFSEFFLKNLQQVLQKLVSRDMRLQLFPKNFWVIDSKLERAYEALKFKKIAKLLSATVLQHCPQCYSFNLRAKVFTYLLELLKQDNHHGFYNSGAVIPIRRDYILEDAFEHIFIK